MSGKLNCNAHECVHNLSGLCSARSISVGGSHAHDSISTDCDTFASKGFVNAVTNLTNMNIPGEIRQLVNKDSIQMSPKVKCEAQNCSYNVDQICGASDVQIYGPGASSSEETQCETFIE